MNNELNISPPFIVNEVELLPVKPQGGLVAFASCIVNHQIYLGNIGVHTRPNGMGYRLVFPSKTLPNGKEIQCFHPITREATSIFIDAISQKIKLIQNQVTKSTQRCGGNHDDQRTDPTTQY